MSNWTAVEILLVEDNPGHARLIEKNLRRANINNKLTRFEDGQQVLDFIFDNNNSTQDPNTTYLMLLDLNLPVVNGYQVLQQLKQDEQTRHIPIIILTTTADTREVEKCYDLGCNIYVTKPVEYSDFIEAIQKIGLFLSIVTVPTYLHQTT